MLQTSSASATLASLPPRSGILPVSIASLSRPIFSLSTVSPPPPTLSLLEPSTVGAVTLVCRCLACDGVGGPTFESVDSRCCCWVDASWGVSGGCNDDADAVTVVSDGVRGWSDCPSRGVQIWLPLSWLPTGVGGNDAAWSPPLFCRATPDAAGAPPPPGPPVSSAGKKLLLIWDKQLM